MPDMPASAYIKWMHISLRSFKPHTGLMICWMVMTLSGPTAHGVSLFGDYSCQRWRGLEYAEKRSWTNAFLAPLSLTMKGLQKSKEDKYNDNPKAYQDAIRHIDAFCLIHPDLRAADAAGQHLKKLFEPPGN
jgi:hypothetical protein